MPFRLSTLRTSWFPTYPARRRSPLDFPGYAHFILQLNEQAAGIISSFDSDPAKHFGIFAIREAARELKLY